MKKKKRRFRNAIMSKTISSFYDFDETLENVSTALNEIVSEDGKLTETKEKYHVNVKNLLKNVSMTQNYERMRNLICFSNIESMDISLTETEDGKTRMDYFAVKDVKSLVTINIVSFVVWLIMSCFFLHFMNKAFLLEECFVFVIMLAMTMFISNKNFTDKALLKHINGNLIPRIQAYSKIAAKNKDN